MRNELKKQRLERELTQKEVALKIGISERYYQSLESGDRKGTVDIWIKLSKLLNVNLEEIYNV